MNTTKSVLPNLYSLRFILATFVILEHAYGLCVNQGLVSAVAFPIFHKATEAVYMFFVLSGFLIIRIIYQEKKSNTFSISHFYTRRATRILPLYLLVSAFGLFYYNFLLPKLGIPFEINYHLNEAVLMLALMIPNVLFTYEPGGILEVLWSIGIEEQFYLFIPVLILAVKHKHILKLLIAAFLGYFYLYHFSEIALPRRYGMTYFFLLCGGVAGVMNEEGKLDYFKKKPILSLAVVLVTSLVFVTDLFTLESRFYDLFTCILFSMAVFVISCANHGFVNQVKITEHLGKISYGIYMYHVIILNLVVYVFLKISTAKTLNDTFTLTLVILLVTSISVVVSHFSYKYMERPLINKARRHERQWQ